jgi:hypothetical protein
MTNEILINTLSNSKQKKTLIGLHNSGVQIDDFCVGYVLDYNESFIVIQHVNKYGFEDGIHVVQIASLEKIETNTSYIKTCQILFQNPSLLPKQSIKNIKFQFSKSWQFDLLHDNSYIGELIAFQLDGSDFFNFGFLFDFDENNIMIHLVGESGESQGTTIYHLIDIASFGIDTLQCRKRKYLHNLTNQASS